MAVDAVGKYAEQDNITDAPKITTLATGHSLGGMLAQVVAKMYGVDAQVQDAPGAARLIDTPQFKQIALENGQPESGHDITGKIQNVTTSNIAKLGEQFQETQVVPIPALGQMGGVDTLATLGTFLANPLAGLATGEALQTVAEHSSVKIEDALYMLAGVKGQIADAGALTLQTMFLGRDGKPVLYAPISSDGSSSNTWQIQALVDKSGKAIAFFDREVVDGEMQPVAVVVQSGNRIHLAHAQDASSPQVIETTVSGERRVLSQSELLTSLQDPRGTPEINIYSADSVNGMDLQSDQVHKAQENTQQSESDASGMLPDTSAPTNANTNTFTHYLDTQGSTLSTAQQDALAAQINKLGLGTDKSLSFYTLPSGGALIATADGDIVGEINRSSTGDLSLKATAIDASGNTVEVNQHINEQGSVQTQEQYNQAQLQSVAQGIGLFNGLMNLQQWDQLSDVGKLSALTGAYNAAHAVGAELAGDLGGFASVLGLMQGLDSGNGWMTLQSGLQVGQMGLNAYSSYMSDAAMQMMDDMMAQSTVDAASSAAFDAAAESALESAAASNAMSNAVPYVSIALALNNLEDNPAQSIGTLVGMYFGGPLGGAIGGFIGGALGGLWGDDDPPPPPDGAVHFSWDANGNIQHTIDYNQSGGGDVANNLATGVQSLLEAVVQAINEKNPSSADDVAINPYLIPRIGYSSQTGGAWLEVTMTDGTTFHEPIFSESIAQKLLETLSNNGGLAPAWQVQTEQAKWQHAQEQIQQLQAQRDALLETVDVQTEDGVYSQQQLKAGQEQNYNALGHQISQAQAHLTELAHDFKLGVGGQSYAGNEAFSLQGNAAESADFKSQTFGALVLHLGDIPGVQAAQTQLTQVLRDVEGDGYFEQTQAVAATDSAGNLQAVLTIDFNGDGVIQTRDILNLGGNTSEGNPTDAARLANANADLQRNNIEWLDANGDGTIDKSDPAFAAIKLWVDVNQDGVQSGNEVSSLASQHISSINFKTGEVTYADGHTDALTAQTLKADTEGIKFTQIREVNPDGTLRTLDAGTVLEHEGYQGQVQITDEGGTRWVDKREQTYEQQALRTGDWEGTAEQEAHRQGGGNVEGAPTQTTATGATNFGPVKAAANQTTQSTVAAGDARVVSDAPTQATVKPNAQVTFVAGDSRIKSDAVPTPSPAANSIRVPETRLAFVPSTQASSTNEIRLVTQDMIESAGSSMFGAAGLGVLGAVGLGATASAAEAAAVQANVVSAGSNTNPSSNSANAVSTNNQFTTTLPTSGASSNTSLAPSTPAEVVVKQAEVFSAPVLVVQGVQTVQTAATSSSTSSPAFVSSTPASPVTEAAPVVVVKAVVISSATSSKASSDSTSATSSATATSTDATSTTSSVSASAATYVTLDYPVVSGETLPGTEDVVLRLSQDVLLANDSSPNASADPNAPALTITAVADAVNGQVSLNDGVVVFMPNTNFHGEASFTYTVTDQYGLSTTGSTTLVIAAVNDAPVTQGETGQTQEDIASSDTNQIAKNDEFFRSAA
ncbi:hypothetical protein B9Z41_07910 [Limnohabitans sp. JirII-31]|nr:hypothetical protein B9Z41_07910 [Limnohabitans sp. JirII-31]